MKPKCLSLRVAMMILGGTPVYAGEAGSRFSHGPDQTPRVPVTVGIVRPTNEGVYRNQALASVSSGVQTPWGPFASPFVGPSQGK